MDNVWKPNRIEQESMMITCDGISWGYSKSGIPFWDIAPPCRWEYVVYLGTEPHQGVGESSIEI